MVLRSDLDSRYETGDFGYSSLESVDNRIVCLMRILLAVSALIIAFIDPTSPERFSDNTYTVLIGYCLYSIVLYFLARRTFSLGSTDIIPWIDVVWYLLLIALSNGTSSIFFFFFFFSVLIAAYRSGFNEGLRLTIVSALLFTIIGYATVPPEFEFELNRFLIRPVYLMMLGYMISYWGGREIKFKRHLILLKDTNRLSNPRFGVNRTLSNIMNRLRTFYDADSCILITFDALEKSYSWREANRSAPSEDIKTEQTAAAAPLVKLPGESAVFYRKNAQFWFFGSNPYAYNISTGGKVEIAADVCTAIADLLDTNNFLTVPIMRHGEMVGRLYLTSQRDCFDRSEIEFLIQLTEQVLRAVENIELLNRIASSAAERQRQKISHDLHDSTIQPYIGLKLGLEALEIKNAAGAPIDRDIEKLLNLTDSTIAELRGYLKTLKDEAEGINGDVLMEAINQQTVKFKEFYDINVTVQAAADFHVNDRLAAEVFQIVSEGLSNIKRHTSAKHASVSIYRNTDKLFLEIENDNPETVAVLDFVPKSIVGRVKSLGGTTRVENLVHHTKVFVEIPL